MRRLGGAVIHMQRNSRQFTGEEAGILSKIQFLAGSAEGLSEMLTVPSKEPFSEDIIEFLSNVSKQLLGNKAAKGYPDVVTLGFWLRRGNVLRLKERYGFKQGIRLGRGTVFHIAPSNVPVNFAYSLFSGLMLGNANIVRVPSKDFEQVRIITEVISKALEERAEFVPYIALVRYGREREINDLLSSMADTRMIWGGDQTIAEIRKSPLPPRSTEITFADRFSLAVIDAEEYLRNKENTARIASDFYNDTYLSDQNACTSPRLVVWTGKRIEEAKEIFWKELHKLAAQKYEFQPIMAISKLASVYHAAVRYPGCRIIPTEDNLIVRVKVNSLTRNLIDFHENCGYFFEYDADDLMELQELCFDNRVQTIGMIGDRNLLLPLLHSGIQGIDRVTDVGHTMDFDLIWDGYDLSSSLTRTII